MQEVPKILIAKFLITQFGHTVQSAHTLITAVKNNEVNADQKSVYDAARTLAAKQKRL